MCSAQKNLPKTLQINIFYNDEQYNLYYFNILDTSRKPILKPGVQRSPQVPVWIAVTQLKF